MPTISLTRVPVAPRYDATAWTHYRIEESLLLAGPYTEVETVAFVLGGTPDDPQPVDVTTELASYDSGWYRLIYTEGLAESLPSAPVYIGPAPAYRPSVAEVADFIRARTKDDQGNEVGTFNDDTRPTGEAVERMINIVIGTLDACVGDWLPERLIHNAKLVVSIGTALLIELTYFPEQIEDNQSAYKSYEKLYTNMKDALCANAAPFRPDDWSPSDAPLYYFGDGALATTVEYDPATERYVFRGEDIIVAVWNT